MPTNIDLVASAWKDKIQKAIKIVSSIQDGLGNSVKSMIIASIPKSIHFSTQDSVIERVRMMRALSVGLDGSQPAPRPEIDVNIPSAILMKEEFISRGLDARFEEIPVVEKLVKESYGVAKLLDMAWFELDGYILAPWDDGLDDARLRGASAIVLCEEYLDRCTTKQLATVIAFIGCYGYVKQAWHKRVHDLVRIKRSSIDDAEKQCAEWAENEVLEIMRLFRNKIPWYRKAYESSEALEREINAKDRNGRNVIDDEDVSMLAVYWVIQHVKPENIYACDRYRRDVLLWQYREKRTAMMRDIPKFFEMSQKERYAFSLFKLQKDMKKSDQLGMRLIALPTKTARHHVPYVRITKRDLKRPRHDAMID